MSNTMHSAAYAQMFGPTVGDKVRLADTDLIIEVEKDFTNYGEEVKFGSSPTRARAWFMDSTGRSWERYRGCQRLSLDH